MKNEEILASLKIGDIVTHGQILYTLKKLKLIWGYSEFGYLESCWVGYRHEDGDRFPFRNLYELFPNGNAPQHTTEVMFPNEERFHNMECGGYITYKGCTFRGKYLDGCFQPYLQLILKDGNGEMETNPRMVLWGIH